jgi:hypothetical protein
MDEHGPREASERPRKPYEAPSIEKVPLRPDEAVLGFCKNNTTPGPIGPNCRAVGSCSTQGS